MSEDLAPAGGPAAAMTSASGVPATAALEKVNLLYHLIIGVAIGIVAPFTALAWGPALMVGYIVGRDQAERARGIRNPAATNILRALLIVIGVGAMLFLGAIVGGLIAVAIVALVAFSERISANTSAADQGIARILVVIVGIAVWAAILFIFRPNINISIG